jgi:hypothetical protein
LTTLKPNANIEEIDDDFISNIKKPFKNDSKKVIKF